MSFLDIKTAARRVVHGALAIPCVYVARGTTVEVPLTARLHDRIVIGGNDEGGGYATIIEGVTRAIFNREELVAAGVTLKKRDRVVFTDYLGVGDLAVELDVRDSYDGPITEKWSVAAI